MDFPRKEAEELSNSSILEFQITDWFVPETDKNREPNEDPELYSILMYGTTSEGNTVCAKIVKFEPWFYVKPPESWNSLSDAGFDSKLQILYTTMMNEKYECFFKNKDTGLTNKYNKKIIPNDYEGHFNGLSMIKKKDFWGFTNNTVFRYIKVSVKSLALYNNLKYYFNSLKNKDFKLYESNIDPFLRYIHIQNIKPCGWVRIVKYIKIDDETRCDYNIQVNWKNVIPIEINKIAPLLIASFDIECTSSHGDFPVAKKDYKKLAQDLANVAKAGYVCSDVYITTWIKNAYVDDVKIDNLVINRLYTKKKFVLSIIDEKLKPRMKEIISILEEISNISGDDSDEVDGDDGCDGDEGDDDKPSPLSVKQQFELETKLNKILTDTLPQLEGDKIIQIGTTVHKYGSDKIIYKHIISLNTCDDIEDTDVVVCTNESDLIKNWKDIISRLNPDILIGYNIFGFDMEYIWIRAQENNILDDFAIGLGKTFNRKVSLVKQQLASSALGENVLKYFDMDGTVIIDLFKVMQREEKLDSYKLDNVATIFLGDKKDDIKPHEIFQKFKGSSKDRCDIAKYCIQDCALVNRLLHKLKMVENNIAMGNVCLVPLNFLFRRGQGIKIFSLIAKQCMDKDLLIPVIRSFDSDFEIDVEGYEGAIVLDPKEGMYLNDPIVVFDYGSLYPSSMIARNLSHDCYVIDKKYMVKDSNIEYITVNYDLYEGIGDKKKKSGVKECIFAKYKDGKKGIIAEILSMLLQERKNTKEKIKYKTVFLKNGTSIFGSVKDKGDTYDIINIDTQEKHSINKIDVESIKNTYDNFEQDVFDGLQLAYKITANSLYGQIGARTSPIYLKDIAACTTATGREMIMMAKNYVETEYNAEVIYGDTDSIFCKFPLKDDEGNHVYGKDALSYAIKIGNDVAKNIVKIMPAPQQLNYEKSLYPFIIFSKKRYVGNLYENNDKDFKQKSMGIVLKRRDNAPIVKKIYGGIIDILLNKQDLNLSIEFLKEELTDMVNGKTPINELIISKSLRGSYKDPTKIAHKVLADRIGARDPGNKPAVNDRVPYVYIKVPDAKLQGDRIENPDYIIENSITPDYLHYITNQIMKPVLQMYALCLEQLPNYDKSGDYWKKIEDELLLKPIYVDDKKRKNRLDNLKLNMVKELLFDEYIYMLSEPKIKSKKIKKDAVIKKNKSDDTVAIVEKISKSKKTKNEIINDANTVIEPIIVCNNEYLKATIKVIKKTSTGLISASGILFDKNKKNIWEYTNEKCKSKENEIKYIIHKMLIDNKDAKIIFNVNSKPFVKDYKIALAKYNNFNKNTDDTIIEKAIQNNDIGILSDINEIISYKNILELKDRFILE
jgi:DNA polymerase delta subunit 1